MANRPCVCNIFMYVCVCVCVCVYVCIYEPLLLSAGPGLEFRVEG